MSSALFALQIVINGGPYQVLEPPHHAVSPTADTGIATTTEAIVIARRSEIYKVGVDLASEQYQARSARAEEIAKIGAEISAKQAAEQGQPFPELTPREREVALLLAVGRACRDIAVELDVSHKTVDTHRMNIMKKLDLRNNVDLARRAIRLGYVAV